MARKYKACKQALSNYKRVNYSHVPTSSGTSSTLTADPWSFIRNHLYRETQGKRGVRKTRLERSLLYVKLAEDFFKAAEIVDLPTKGTLYYYGMMNLVKSYLGTQGVDLEDSIEHHGLSASPPLKKQLKVLKITNALSIFGEFTKKLGITVNAEQILDLKEIFRNVPELHNIYAGIYHSQKPKFLPIQIDYCVSEDNKFLVTELRYRKEYQRQYPCHKFSKDHRKEYFIRLREENYTGSLDQEWVTYRSKSRKKLVTGSKSNWDTLYSNIQREYSRFNLCSILTRQGYYYYCDLEPGDFQHLCYSYMAMYYIGTAARYKPLEFHELLDGDMRPLITEAIAICPRQFLYQLASLITKRVCVVPYASI